MSQDDINLVAQSMEELTYARGEVIIRQDETGDSLFVIEEGTVEVSEKVNSTDDDEEPTILASVGSGSIFGERSLMNREPRSATVMATSETVRCLRMTKETFDLLMETNNKLSGTTRETIAKDVVKRLALFQNFTNAEREAIFAAMAHNTFQQGAYVFRQGSIGNQFFIITSGLLSVTVSGQRGKDKEISRLQPGDYFGELALIGSSSKRSANVLVLETCNLMSLSRADFGKFLGGLKDEMLRNQSTKRSIKSEKKKNAISFVGKRR